MDAYGFRPITTIDELDRSFSLEKSRRKIVKQIAWRIGAMPNAVDEADDAFQEAYLSMRDSLVDGEVLPDRDGTASHRGHLAALKAYRKRQKERTNWPGFDASGE